MAILTFFFFLNKIDIAKVWFLGQKYRLFKTLKNAQKTLLKAKLLFKNIFSL